MAIKNSGFFLEKDIISYKKYVNFRRKLTLSFARFFVFLGISADAITYFRLFLMFVTFYFIKADLLISAILFFLILFLDIIDGHVAELNKTHSDNGKFKDFCIDLAIESLLIISLIYAGALNQIFGSYLIFISISMMTLSVIDYSRYQKSDWLFKARVAFMDIVPRIIIFTVYFIYALFSLNLFNTLLTPLLLIYMTALAIWHFYCIAYGRSE